MASQKDQLLHSNLRLFGNRFFRKISHHSRVRSRHEVVILFIHIYINVIVYTLWCLLKNTIYTQNYVNERFHDLLVTKTILTSWRGKQVRYLCLLHPMLFFVFQKDDGLDADNGGDDDDDVDAFWPVSFQYMSFDSLMLAISSAGHSRPHVTATFPWLVGAILFRLSLLILEPQFFAACWRACLHTLISLGYIGWVPTFWMNNTSKCAFYHAISLDHKDFFILSHTSISWSGSTIPSYSIQPGATGNFYGEHHHF